MPSGILLIDKPSGVTSRYVDNRFQWVFATRKVGHLGTLDPFATGLLIVAVGESTKYLPFLRDEEKTYQATLKLGCRTDSGDYTGEAIEEAEVPELTSGEIEKVLSSFLGESTQIPPMTSAIKKDGKPLYKYARAGEEIEREPRPIYIHSIRLISYEKPLLAFEATVSKGTYIRTLGEDIAKALGTLGHLTELRRLAIGPFRVNDAVTMDEAGEKDLRIPADFVEYPRIELTGKELVQARNGVKLPLDTDASRILVMGEGKAIAIYEKEDSGVYRCLRGL